MRRRLREWYGDAAIVWLNACLLFLVMNVVLAVIHAGAPKLPELGPMPASIARAHPDLDPAALARLVAESKRTLVYAPYTDMTDPPVTGRFVNVDPAGFRRSVDQGPWPPDGRNLNVFVFGGSTTFGYGVADEHTIASYLQPRLDPADGHVARVYNFGHSGYYSTQERILFERLVVAGRRPDVAIFIDGLNDFAAVDDAPITATRLEYGFRTTDESVLRTAFLALPLTTTVLHAGRNLGLVAPPITIETHAPPAYDDVEYVGSVLERYQRSKRAIEGIGAAYGIRTVFVWQPVATYEFPPGDAGHWGGAGANAWARRGYPLFAKALATEPVGANFVWCADVGADGTEAFYVDLVHYAPVMAERVARCIADGMHARRGGVP
jgi:lysophospholipase L1-like esterase